MTEYDNTIYPDNSPEVFRRGCRNLEVALSGIERERLLIDLDGSTIQIYHVTGKDGARLEIRVYDDYDVGAVYIQSELDLGCIIHQIKINV